MRTRYNAAASVRPALISLLSLLMISRRVHWS
jgi:hypothetical protein